MQLSSRTASVGNPPITEALRQIHAYRGPAPLINLTQGVPHYPPPTQIVRHVLNIASSPEGGEYTERPGLPALRQLVAADVDSAGSVKPDSVSITTGCNQAFCIGALAIADPDTEVILATPHYFNHSMWLQMNGIRTVFMDTRPSYVPSPSSLKAHITDRTRAVVLVSPGNPTGVTIPSANLLALAEVCRSARIALILDETYRSFTGESSRHTLFQLPWWQETVVALYSFSKEFAIPGYRVGAIVAGHETNAAIAKLFDCVGVCAPRIGQEAAIAGLTYAKSWRTDRAQDVRHRGERFVDMLAGEPGGFRVLSSGGFFTWVEHRDAQVTNREILAEAGVAVLPGSLFSVNPGNTFRLCHANLDERTSNEVATRLSAF